MPARPQTKAATCAAIQISVLALFALAMRWNALGDPNYQIDETFYLVVGDAMHHGAVPYVDIWDRKPPGLFVIYWFAATFRDPVLAYQLLALASVVLTAWVLSRIARSLAGEQAVLFSGLTYIAMLQPLLGGGGQSPVFYTLPVALAAWLFVDQIRGDAPARLERRAIMAALAGGIALSIKPTAVIESAFICLAFVWRAASIGVSRFGILRLLAVMALAGAAPMLAAFAWYAMQGQFPAIWQATVLSIFERRAAALPDQLQILRYTLGALAPLLALAALGALRAPRMPATRFIGGWTLAAALGFVAVPGFYLHYALPLAAPLAVMAAPIFGMRLFGPLAAAALIGVTAITGGSLDLARKPASIGAMQEATAAVRNNLGNGILYVYSGPPLLYLTSGSARPTRFLFPEHLSIRDEMAATGVDTAAEEARILALRPAVIAIRARPFRAPNPLTCLMVRASLLRDYRLIRKVTMVEFAGPYDLLIYARTGAGEPRTGVEATGVCEAA